MPLGGVMFARVTGTSTCMDQGIAFGVLVEVMVPAIGSGLLGSFGVPTLNFFTYKVTSPRWNSSNVACSPTPRCLDCFSVSCGVSLTFLKRLLNWSAVLQGSERLGENGFRPMPKRAVLRALLHAAWVLLPKISPATCSQLYFQIVQLCILSSDQCRGVSLPDKKNTYLTCIILFYPKFCEMFDNWRNLQRRIGAHINSCP